MSKTNLCTNKNKNKQKHTFQMARFFVIIILLYANMNYIAAQKSTKYVSKKLALLRHDDDLWIARCKAHCYEHENQVLIFKNFMSVRQCFQNFNIELLRSMNYLSFP